MNTSVEKAVPVLPQDIESGKWVSIRPDYYDHPLEKSLTDTGDGFTYVRKPRDKNQTYKVSKDLEWKCLKCDSDLLSTRVAHTIRDGMFPLSGSGEVKYEDVPFCPKCEKIPTFHGSPVSA